MEREDFINFAITDFTYWNGTTVFQELGKFYDPAYAFFFKV